MHWVKEKEKKQARPLSLVRYQRYQMLGGGVGVQRQHRLYTETKHKGSFGLKMGGGHVRYAKITKQLKLILISWSKLTDDSSKWTHKIVKKSHFKRRTVIIFYIHPTCRHILYYFQRQAVNNTFQKLQHWSTSIKFQKQACVEGRGLSQRENTQFTPST